MAIVKRNVRVGRPILQCKLTGGDRLVALVDLQTSCAVKILDSKTQTDLGGFSIPVSPKSPLDFFISGHFVFALDRNLDVVDLYDLDSKKKARSFDIKPSRDGEPSAIAASEDGTRFAVGDKRGVFTFWSTDNAQPIATVKGFEPISLIELSANAETAAIAFENGDITIVKTADLNNQSSLELHKRGVSALKFVGNYLISGDLEGRVAAWNVENGKLARVYPIGKGAIKAIDRAFDDRAAIVATEGGALALTDINRDRQALELDMLGEGLVSATFDDKTDLSVAVTSSWNMLFFDLLDDKSIEIFLTPKNGEDRVRSDAIKVIVTDDSATMRRVIQAALKSDFPSLEILEASNGKEALELLEQNPDVKIMFLDWNMPTMSGEATVAKIKEAKIYPNLLIVMATTEGGHEKVMQMLRMGVAGYLVKPFRRDAITKITSKLMERIAV